MTSLIDVWRNSEVRFQLGNFTDRVSGEGNEFGRVPLFPV